MIGASLLFVLALVAIYYGRLDLEIGQWLVLLPVAIGAVAAIALIAWPALYRPLVRTRVRAIASSLVIVSLVGGSFALPDRPAYVPAIWLKAPLCEREPSLKTVGAQRAARDDRSRYLLAAVESQLRGKSGNEAKQALADLMPCLAAAEVDGSDGSAYVVSFRPTGDYTYYRAVAFDTPSGWRARAVIEPQTQSEIAPLIASRSGDGLDLLFNDGGYLELYRLTDDLRSVWKSGPRPSSSPRVLTNELVLLEHHTDLYGVLDEQQLLQKRDAGFDVIATRHVPSLQGLLIGLSYAEQGRDRTALRALATNDSVVDRLLAGGPTLLPPEYSTGSIDELERGDWDALPAASRSAAPPATYIAHLDLHDVTFVRLEGGWKLQSIEPSESLGGSPLFAHLAPTGLATDRQGNVYIADAYHDRVLKVNPDGIIARVAGTGVAGFAGDGGPATEAQLRGPFAVAVGEDGTLFIADSGNGLIRRVGRDGIISTFGGPLGTKSGDRPRVTGVAVAPDGALYAVENTRSQIVRIAPGNRISVVAGTGAEGFSGDGGPAAAAQLSGPFGIALDDAGNLYVADSRNNRVRRIGPDGIITTVAGTGTAGFAGDGASATDAQLDSPFAVAVDAEALYIADSNNDRIRKVSGGQIATFAGSGAFGSSGDGGLPTQARFTDVFGIAASGGAVFIADTGNALVRVVHSESITTFAGSAGSAPTRTGSAKDRGPDNFRLVATGWGDTGGAHTFFVLMGNGTTVYVTRHGLQQRRLSIQGTDYVVRAVIASGLTSLGTLGSRPFPGEEPSGCCGAGTVLEVDGASAGWTIGVANFLPSPARERLESLIDRLGRLEEWVPPNLFVDSGEERYDASAYEVTTSVTWDGCSEYKCGLAPDPRSADVDRFAWPLDPSVVEFRAFEGCRGLSAGEATTIVDAVRRAGDVRIYDLADSPDIELNWPRFAGSVNLRLAPLAPWENACSRHN